jgi:hypothetical protein
VLSVAPASLPPAQPAALLHEFERSDAALACRRPAGAYANCLAVSARCVQWLRTCGVETGLVHLAGSLAPFPEGAGRWPFCDPAGIEHWTVRVGDWSVDWTARQFHRGAGWPALERVEALGARWRLVEEWACPRCPQLVADARHLELTPAGLAREHRALARSSGGRGPFRDPRHDGTPALVRPCACPPGAARGGPPAPRR